MASKAHFRGKRAAFALFRCNRPIIFGIRYWFIRPMAPQKRKGGTFPPKMRLTGPELVFRIVKAN